MKINAAKEATAKAKAPVDSSEKVLKKKALEVTFSQIDKEYGNGAVMLLGQAAQLLGLKRFLPVLS